MISASFLAVEKLSDISPLLFIGVLQVRPQIIKLFFFEIPITHVDPLNFISTFFMSQALVPHMFMNIYTNGVNQLFDIEIDKVCNLLLETKN